MKCELCGHEADPVCPRCTKVEARNIPEEIETLEQLIVLMKDKPDAVKILKRRLEAKKRELAERN